MWERSGLSQSLGTCIAVSCDLEWGATGSESCSNTSRTSNLLKFIATKKAKPEKLNLKSWTWAHKKPALLPLASIYPKEGQATLAQCWRLLDLHRPFCVPGKTPSLWTERFRVCRAFPPGTPWCGVGGGGPRAPLRYVCSENSYQPTTAASAGS